MTILLDLPRIIRELKLDVPVYCVRAQDNCVELHLYGGKVVTWKPNHDDSVLESIQQDNMTVKASEIKTGERDKKKGRKSR